LPSASSSIPFVQASGDAPPDPVVLVVPAVVVLAGLLGVSRSTCSPPLPPEAGS
jgi:hypothetical protein